MTARIRRRRNPQRGSAMMVTMIIIGALLAGAAVLVSLQLASNRSTDLTRSGTSALYCAEAGLAIARPVVANGYAEWKNTLVTSAGEYITGVFTEPAWLQSPTVDHDLDNPGGGAVDFLVYIIDNDDEGGVASDLTLDKDLSVYIVSKCLKYPDTEVEVRELVTYNAGTAAFTEQLGGGTGINSVVTE